MSTCQFCAVIGPKAGHKIPRPFTSDVAALLERRPELADMAQVGAALVRREVEGA